MTSILNYESYIKVLFLFVPFVLWYVLLGRKKFKNKFNALFSENYEHIQITTNLFILIEVAIWAVIILAFWDIFLVHQKIKDFGQWGDFFGGVLNPILTFLTFVGLMITIILQQIELKESRTEFKRTADALHKQEEHMSIQGFENTFFKMLELHNNIVENLTYCNRESSISTQGKEVFEDIYKWFLLQNEQFYLDIGYIERYKEFIYNNHNQILGHYFRNLYQILKFIKEQEERLNFDSSRYSNLLRAQLSSYELILLFFNCFEGVSDDGQFKKLLIKFSFLQHFPIKSIEQDDNIIFVSLDSDIIILTKDEWCQYFESTKSAFNGNKHIENFKCI